MRASFRHRPRPIVCLMLTALACPLALATPGAGQSSAAPQCKPASSLVQVRELPEGSGLAASRRTPGRIWSHNDSGEPVLFALNDRGAVSARLRLTGAKVEDWEAVAVGPCPGGACIYVGDIGDNDAERKRITIYRVVEPAEATGDGAAVDTFHATYPDGAHDAETLLVSPDGRLFIVTKGETGPVALYRFPRELRAGSTVRLERVGQPREPGASGKADRITDGSVSPDGRWTVLRSTEALTFYRTTDLLEGRWQATSRVPVTSLKEPQGEGVAFGHDENVYLAGEGGGRSRPGTFVRLECTLSR